MLDRLSSLERYFVLPKTMKNATASWLFFPFLVRDGAPFMRFDLIEWLESQNIETRPVLSGNISRQPGFRESKFRSVGGLQGTDTIMRQSVCVGIHPGIGRSELDFVAEQMEAFCRQF
jgi:CDP-6-deoxy-D-xylo-4-hexulose-3-dehydrase